MNLTVSGLQYDIVWENKDANINKIEKLLKDVPSQSEIVLLPEMFTTGFSMNTIEMGESMDGLTLNWMKFKAKGINKVIAGSLIIKEDNKYKNRFLFVEPNGNVQYYDKRHSFGLGDEDKYFSIGNERVVIEYKGWKIFPTICYDLRFPEWIKNNLNYDIIFNVANWPNVRAEHWKTFLQSRAVENQSYVFGLNRIGTDEKNRHYSGDSSIFDFDGNILTQFGEIEGVLTATFSKTKLKEYRENYPFLKDQDKYEIDF